ncbi:MAG: tetratricopeptide repeat protein, partial [Chitinophagaceae bacterium]
YNTEEQTTESILCLNRLAEIEFDFLSFYSLYDSIKKKEQINKFEKHLKEYPKSLRIQYLYGKLNYDMGFYNIGLPVFHNLLQKKYYENPILELMFEFYSIIDDDSVMHYAKVFSDRFPDNCNLGNLSVLIKQNQDSLFMEECEKCLKSEKLTDSIKAKIEMAKFYLNTRDFLKVKRLYNDYKIKNKDFTFNDFKIWETGEYYDIFLRSLFLQKRYRDFYEFIQNEMGYNKKINVENEKDFYKLIRKYHADYSESQSIEFDKFFNENFFLDQG